MDGLEVQLGLLKNELQKLTQDLSNLPVTEGSGSEVSPSPDTGEELSQEEMEFVSSFDSLYQKNKQKLNVKNPVALRIALRSFYNQLKNSLSLPDLMSFYVSYVIKMEKMKDIEYRDFQTYKFNVLNLLQLILQDTVNWFDEKNNYKGQDTINYRNPFAEDNYKLFEQAIKSFKELLKEYTPPVFRKVDIVAYEEKEPKFKLWIGLPPTITNNPSPLEQARIDHLKTKLKSYQTDYNQKKPIDGEQFRSDFEALKSISWRNMNKEIPHEFANLYGTVLNIDNFGWSTLYKPYYNKVTTTALNLRNNYNSVHGNYKKIKIKDRTAKDYDVIREAIYDFVAAKPTVVSNKIIKVAMATDARYAPD